MIVSNARQTCISLLVLSLLLVFTCNAHAEFTVDWSNEICEEGATRTTQGYDRTVTKRCSSVSCSGGIVSHEIAGRAYLYVEQLCVNGAWIVQCQIGQAPVFSCNYLDRDCPGGCSSSSETVASPTVYFQNWAVGMNGGSCSGEDHSFLRSRDLEALFESELSILLHHNSSIAARRLCDDDRQIDGSSGAGGKVRASY